MAQDTSGTFLAIAAAQTSRLIAYSVFVDFADVGFRVYPNGWTNITQYVKRLDGDMQATDWRKTIAVVGSGVSDECTVTLQNPEDSGAYSGLRYSSANEASSLYSLIGDGLINMKRCIVEMGFNYLGDDYRLRQITGYITGAGEQRAKRGITFTVRDRAADATMTKAATQLYGGVTAARYMATLASKLDKDPVSTADQLFDSGMVLMNYMWMDDDGVWDEMSTVAESQLGRVWFDKDGILHFDDGTHFVKPATNSWDDATVSQFSFTTSNVKSVDARYDMGSIFNHIVVEYQPRYIAASQVVYGATETTIVPPGLSRVIRCEYRYPLYDLTMPTAGVGLKATTAGGTDISDDISITWTTNYATYSEITLTNANENYAAYVYQMDITGRPLLSEQADKYEAEDTTSITRYGRRTWRVANPYIVTYRHAQTVGDYLLARYKDPIQVIRIAGARGVPWLEVGDRVTVADTLSGIDGEYFLTHIRWSYSPGSPYTMDITAMKAEDLFAHLDEYFVIATSTYGYPIWTPTTQGRMFW